MDTLKKTEDIHALSKHTPGHLDCPACERMRIIYSRCITADLTFSFAAETYLKLRSVASAPGAVTGRYIRRNTEKDYERKLRAVSLFFGDTRLRDIRWYHMRAYQQARLAGEAPFVRKRQPHRKEVQPCPAKPKQVNQELALLKQILVRAGTWRDEDENYFEYLQEDQSEVARSLTPQEQQRWLDTARSRPRWELVYWWSIVALDTLMSTNELRGLRLGDVKLHHGLIDVPWPAAKNRFRHRSIPIENPDAAWAVDQLLHRAASLGSREPVHYLFPFRITRSRIADPTRPMTESGLKKLWEEVRAASGLTWFRMYDCRHTGATRFAEAGLPTEIIVARMGHCSDKMRRHYTHISEHAQRGWLRGVGPRRDGPQHAPESMRFGPRSMGMVDRRASRFGTDG